MCVHLTAVPARLGARCVGSLRPGRGSVRLVAGRWGWLGLAARRQTALDLEPGPAAPVRCLLAAQEIANDVVKEQSPKQLYTVRGKLYELLANCVPPDVILRTLLTEMLAKMDDDIKVGPAQPWGAWRGTRPAGGSPLLGGGTRARGPPRATRRLLEPGGWLALQAEVVRHAAFYEHRLCEGQKAIFHLEAFVARVMQVGAGGGGGVGRGPARRACIHAAACSRGLHAGCGKQAVQCRLDSRVPPAGADRTAVAWWACRCTGISSSQRLREVVWHALGVEGARTRGCQAQPAGWSLFRLPLPLLLLARTVSRMRHWWPLAGRCVPPLSTSAAPSRVAGARAQRRSLASSRPHCLKAPRHCAGPAISSPAPSTARVDQAMKSQLAHSSAARRAAAVPQVRARKGGARLQRAPRAARRGPGRPLPHTAIWPACRSPSAPP